MTSLKKPSLKCQKKPQEMRNPGMERQRDVAKVFATMLSPGEEPCEDIANHALLEYLFLCQSLVLSTGRIRCWLQIRRSGSQAEKSSLIPTLLDFFGLYFRRICQRRDGAWNTWGTPGTRQMKVRAKVARFPYNQVISVMKSGMFRIYLFLGKKMKPEMIT